MVYSTTRRHLLALTAALTLSPAWAAKTLKAKAASLPPPAPAEPVTDTYWGVQLTDPYRWMEAQPQSERFKGWLKGQHEYARTALDALAPRAAIRKRIDHYAGEEDMVSFVRPAGGKLFIMMRAAGQEGMQLFLRDSPSAPQRLLIDPNAGRKAGAPANALDWQRISPDGRYVMFGLSEGGSELSICKLLNVSTGAVSEISRLMTRPGGFTADGTGLFYWRIRSDAVKGATDFLVNGSCWLHRIGSDPARDIEVFRSGEGPGYEAMESDAPFVTGAPGSDWVLGSHVNNGLHIAQLYVARADQIATGKAAWRKIGDRSAGMMQAFLHGDHVYVLAKGRASGGEVVKIDARNGDFASAPVVLPAVEGSVANFISMAADGVYVHDVTGSSGGLRRLGHGGKVERVNVGRTGSMWGFGTAYDAPGCWFQMDELTWPGLTFHVDGALATRQVAMFKPPKFDTSPFTTTRVEAPMRDGVKVTLEILHRKDLKLNGRNPTLINAYGAYGSILDMGFSATTLAFLELGGVLVYAHVRGGGERGDAWHKAGMKATKHNTWRDAIDSAEYLIKLGYTGKRHLALWGVSAGGIMMGRAITERPDLFAVAIGEVGIFNTVRFELSSNGPGNDAEFGTVKKEEEFKGLLAMDAYHAVRDGVRYPAVLLLAGANDLRVEPWYVAKFAARLQAASARSPGALLRVEYEGGHFSTTQKSSGDKMADIFAFVLANTR
jgi:prolyl oligopeptidase